MRVLSDVDLHRFLDMGACIAAVEAAFAARAEGRPATSAVAALELVGGVLHAKLGRLDGRRRYAIAKINANFPGNRQARGLPTIQGVALLFDASSGSVLAALDSPALTAIRTAAATAVAAKYLATATASSVSIVGCGVQAAPHIEALLCVRPIRKVSLFDLDRDAARKLADEVSRQFDVSVHVAADLRAALGDTEIVVTATPSREPILRLGDVRPGTFVAAVGADSETKQELDPLLLREAIVVVDDLAQCSHFGDLHHALAAGTMRQENVRGSLDQVVAGKVAGRTSDEEITVFDSTGVAIEDVAAAAIAFERAEAAGAGVLV